MSEVLTIVKYGTAEGRSDPSEKYPEGRPWTRYDVEDDWRDRYSTFDSTVGKFLKEHIGQQVNIEYEQKGKYRNLISAWPLDGEQPSKKKGPPVPVAQTKDDFMRQRHPGESRIIAKQACLKAAVKLAARNMDLNVDHVLDLADRFVEWVFQEDGIRHIKAASPAEVEKEIAAIKSDVPAEEAVKALVVSLIPSARADAKAILQSYDLKTVKEVQARLTAHVAELFLEANGAVGKEPVEIPF